MRDKCSIELDKMLLTIMQKVSEEFVKEAMEEYEGSGYHCLEEFVSIYTGMKWYNKIYMEWQFGKN